MNGILDRLRGRRIGKRRAVQGQKRPLAHRLMGECIGMVCDVSDLGGMSNIYAREDIHVPMEFWEFTKKELHRLEEKLDNPEIEEMIGEMSTAHAKDYIDEVREAVEERDIHDVNSKISALRTTLTHHMVIKNVIDKICGELQC